MRFRTLVVLALMIPGLTRVAGFAAQQARLQSGLPQDTYTVVHTFPHDRDAFTQGLQYVDGVFYEGTGLNGRSSVRKVKLETGEVLQRRDVAQEYFGEGITVWKNDLFELTWQNRVALLYD